MTLRELRKAMGKTQAQLARRLGKPQAGISRTEAQSDMPMSTLGEVVEGLGGRIQLVAELPGRAPVRIAGRACSRKLPLALVLLDIGHFKRYNDRYGHPAGDACLRRVTEAVKAVLWRTGDQPARYGGEEIAVLLPDADLEGAKVTGERIRLAIERLGIEHAHSDHRVVTVSAGAASIAPFLGDEMAEDLVAAADIALYQAKKRGRNMVCAGLPGEATLIDAIDLAAMSPFGNTEAANRRG